MVPGEVNLMNNGNIGRWFNRTSHNKALTEQNHMDPLILIWFIFNPTWISNHMHSKVWGEITYPSPNFNGCTVEDLGNDKVISSNILSLIHTGINVNPS